MAVRKWGTETLVNTTTAGNQQDPAVTALADGGYVIAWEDTGSTPPAVRFQIYEADGTPRGGEITGPAGSVFADGNSNPALAPLDNGGFILSLDDAFSATDADPRYQRYDADGNTVGIIASFDSDLGIEQLSAVAPLARASSASGATTI